MNSLGKSKGSFICIEAEVWQALHNVTSLWGTIPVYMGLNIQVTVTKGGGLSDMETLQVCM